MTPQPAGPAAVNASPPRVAVVGAGWAGLAAAVRLVQRGAAVTVLEMAPQPGGRARALPAQGAEPAADNGQHILIGAYARTLALMRTVGVEPGAVLRRMPLVLHWPDGAGLALPPGPAAPAFLRGVLGARGWRVTEKLALLRAAAGWALQGFDCDDTLSVAALTRTLPPAVRQRLIDPLCVATLNTPAQEASARVLLRVLRDALFGPPGSADLLLPAQPLDALLPGPAWAWLQRQGAAVHTGRRAGALVRDGAAGPWRLDGEPFDAVVLACSAAEAARLAEPHAAAWAAQARALRYEPIVTVLLDWPGAALPAPMTALVEGTDAPAQFAFDHGALGLVPGRFAFVVSGARPWVERGLAATGEAVRRQAMQAFARPGHDGGPQVRRVLAEKRATFRCTPGLQRPPAAVAPGLWAAGDFIAGPYPATLEGAVRAGEAAAEAAVTAVTAMTALTAATAAAAPAAAAATGPMENPAAPAPG
jgi:squalene-associated FAD-dependent desaturase